MKIKNKLTMTATALVAGLVSLQQAAAATVSTNLGILSADVTTSGTFSDQGEVFEAMFALSSPSNVTLFTKSYGGGPNLSGAASMAGGLEPQITLYTGAGNYVASETVTSPLATVDPATGLATDAYLFDGPVPAGAYIAVLTDFLNQQSPSATNLSDGFIDFGAGGGNYIDEQGNTRNGNYSLNLSATSVPEPATFWLSIPILAFGLAQFRKRRS